MKQEILECIRWDALEGVGKHNCMLEIREATLDQETLELKLAIALNFIIPYEDLEKIKEMIMRKLPEIRGVSFHFAYCNLQVEEEQALKLYFPYLQEKVKEISLSLATSMTGNFDLEGASLTLYSIGNASTEAMNQLLSQPISAALKDAFGWNIRISFANDLTLYQKKVQDLEKASQKEIEQMLKASNRTRKMDAVAVNVYGKKPCTNVERIENIKGEDQKKGCEGQILSMRLSVTKNNKNIATIVVGDATGTISCKMFPADATWEKICKEITVGDLVRIGGRASEDKFEGGWSLITETIEKLEPVDRIDESKEKRVELHAHTTMSAMDGVSTVFDLVQRASDWDHSAIAITDHGTVMGFSDAIHAKRELGSDIKIIYGMEAYYYDDQEALYYIDETAINEAEKKTDQKAKTYHMIILAKNQVGLKNLFQLVSLSQDHFYRRPRIPKSLLTIYREGLILGSACQAGDLYQAILANSTEPELVHIIDKYDYLEIQPSINNRFMIGRPGIGSIDDIHNIDRKIVELGKKYGKPVVATCDVHYVNPDDTTYRKIVMANMGYKSIENDQGLFFRTTSEMLDLFSYLGEETAREVVIENPCKIADGIEDLSDYLAKEENMSDCMERLKERIHDAKLIAVQESDTVFRVPSIHLDRMISLIREVFGEDQVFFAATPEKLSESNLEGYIGRFLSDRGIESASLEVHRRFAAPLSNVVKKTGCSKRSLIVLPKEKTIPVHKDMVLLNEVHLEEIAFKIHLKRENETEMLGYLYEMTGEAPNELGPDPLGYFETYHPVAYTAAYISVYGEAAMEIAYQILPADLNHSEGDWYRADGDKIYAPIASIPGIEEEEAVLFMESHKESQIHSMDDLIGRNILEKRAIKALEDSGVLSNLPKTNQIFINI